MLNPTHSILCFRVGGRVMDFFNVESLDSVVPAARNRTRDGGRGGRGLKACADCLPYQGAGPTPRPGMKLLIVRPVLPASGCAPLNSNTGGCDQAVSESGS